MIPKWLLKAMVQGMVSHLPQRDWINNQLQKRLTKRLVPSRDAWERRLKWCGEHLGYYRRCSVTGTLPESVLELGTGWFVALPIALHLCGIPRIYSIDIRHLIEQEYFDAMLDILSDYSLDELKAFLPDLQEERLAEFKQLVKTSPSQQEVLAHTQVELLIADARHTNFPDSAVDFVISNTTLEHIPYQTLAELFQEFHRILEPGGLMSHLIDLSDHYHHLDKSITAYNFLRYDDFTWRFLNNELQYQNRLREPDYRKIHLTTGFQMVDQVNYSGSADDLAGMNVAKRFRSYSQDELLVYNAWMISTPTETITESSMTARDSNV